MKKYAQGGDIDKTMAEIVAERMNKGKTTEQLLQEAKDRDIKQKMSEMPARPLPAPGETRPGEGMTDESRKMMEDTNAGYEYATKKKAGGAIKKMAAGGSTSASKRADGCAVRGKTKGRML